MLREVKEFLAVFVGAALLFLVFLLLVFPHGLTHLDSTFFSATHDGIKNYFTFLHYLKHEAGFDFTGMAYPYADLITFTDNQPLLAYTLKAIGAPETMSLSQALFIFNALLLLALPVSVYFIYRIFTHYQVKPLSAFFMALVLAFLAPQNERIFGHYGLAYSFFIPVIWFYTLQFLSTKHNKYLYINVGFVLAMCFIHVYYLAIALVFFGFTAIGYGLTQAADDEKKLWPFIKILLMGLLPILLFKVFMSMADTKVDRVEVPWGFLNYRATFRSIFFNPDSPFDALIPNAIQAGKYETEGDAYVGVLGLFFALYVIITVIKNWVQTKTFSLNLIQLPAFNIFIYTGIFSLIFAAVFPFYMPPLDYFIQFIKPLLQFRSPGRFAWIFFEVFMVFMLIFFYQKSLKEQTAWRRYFYYLPALLLLIDGMFIQKKLLAAVNHHNEGKAFLQSDIKDILKEKEIDASHYHALIALPFFTIGNEKAGFAGSEKSIFNAMALTFHSGLPMVNYMMSRTSVSEGLGIAAIMSHPILPKYYFNQFSGPKPFLVMVTPDALSPFEQAFLRPAEFLFQHGDIKFYSLNPERIVPTWRHYDDSIERVPVYQYPDKAIYATTPNLGFFHYQMNIGIYELEAAEDFSDALEGKYTLYEGKMNVKDSLEISFWTRSLTAMNGFAVLRVTEKDASGNIVYHYNSHLEPYPQIHNMCRRIAHTYKPKSPENTVLIEAEGKAYKWASFLIYERPNHVYVPTKDEMVIWDNYPTDPDTMLTILNP